jgi:hypothetical protein
MFLRNSSFSARVLYLVALVACTAFLNSPAQAQFETRATTTLPQGADCIALGDFNNDGKLDLVVTDYNGFTVSLGNGDGTFQKYKFYRTQLSYYLALADFNHDGNLDIVVANLSPSTVDVYLGNGDGTFRAPITSNTTEGSYFVAVGDFNGDGKPDLALLDPPYISILLGKGNGKFQAPNDNNSFTGGQWLALGDFNNDHHLDVIVTGTFGGSYSIGVLLGNGNGTLQDSIDTPLEYVPATVEAGDLNGDGKLDAVLGYDLSGIAVLLGNGDGTFQPAVNYDTTGLGNDEIAIADLNGNGKLDLVVSGSSGKSAGVDVFWGNGDGTLQPAEFFSSGLDTGLLTMGDLNNDGLPDIALANGGVGTITMLNTGAISLSPTTAPLNFTKAGQQTLKLANTGTKALSIASITSSSTAFEVRNTCGSSVPAGGNCNISILFRPPGNGEYSGLISLRDSASSKPQYISVSGSGN